MMLSSNASDFANQADVQNEANPLSEASDIDVEYSLPSHVNQPAHGYIRIIKTTSFFANFLFLLAACAQSSAALVDLASLYSVSLATISVFQSINCVSYISGTWIGGLLYTRLNVFGLLSGFSVVLMLGLAMCSFMPNIALFFATSGLGAIAGGAIDSIVNSHFLALWDGHRIRDSLMQGLHAAWSAGAMGLGAALKPFLDPNLTASTNSSSAFPYSGRVQFAYILFASLGTLPLSTHILLFAWDHWTVGSKRRKRTVDRSNTLEAPVKNGESDIASKAQPSKLSGCSALIVILFAILVRLFDVEGFISSFLSSYLFYGLKWSTPDASVAFSVFFAGQFSGRLLSVLVSAFVRPLHILLANGLLIVASGIVLGTFGHIMPVPYVTSFVMGIGNSSSFPSVFLWLSEFVPITGPVSASLFLGDLVSLLSPAFGHVIETSWPAFFVCFTSASGFLSVCSLAIGNCVGRRLVAKAVETDGPQQRELCETSQPMPT